MKCDVCEGTGEAVFSCCTQEVIVDDNMMCPVCHEHLGLEECDACGGTGEVEEHTRLPIYDAQFVAESLMEDR